MFENGNKLLLATGDPNLIRQIQSISQSLAIDLTVLDSDKDVLERILDINPDCIIMEFHADGIDGKGLFNRIVTEKTFAPVQPVPVLFFSDEESRMKHGHAMFDSGLRGWYVKPLEIHALEEILKNVFMMTGVLQKNRELKQEVRRSEYRYRDLLENATDLIFTLDQNGRFVYLNNRFTSLTSFSKEAWLDRSFQDLIHPGDRLRIGSHYEMIQQGRARIFESRICHRENHMVHVSFSISPIVEKGTIQGAMGIGRDNTEQRMMEQEILELKNFNESIIQSMEAGLLTIDLEGIITSLNQMGEKITGWHEKEIVGNSFESFLSPEKMDILTHDPRPNRLPPYSREAALISKSKKRIAIGYTATDRIDNAGRKVGTIISFRDMTELKQMQTELFRMDRLASLGVLASGIAHEIKNPLAGIKTMAQACEEEIEFNDPRREYLIRIGKQVNRLDELLKTFFAYARPKPPDRKPCDLGHILREVHPLYKKKLSKQGIVYQAHLDANLPYVLVDAQQMQQVFLNLILNAIDAMPQGGEIRIAASVKTRTHLNLNYTEPSDILEIKLSDTGFGIQEDDCETIFDPFFTTKSTGLGLGLSIVYRIIEEHQGRIYVNSQVGQGTTFFIELPIGAKNK